MRTLGEALIRRIKNRERIPNKPKHIDEITFDKGSLSIVGWSKSGPPQSVRLGGWPIYQRESTHRHRNDVAAHFGAEATQWGFICVFDLHTSDLVPERLTLVFPDGEVLSGATARRILIRTEVERIVSVPSADAPARRRPPLSGAVLSDVSNGVWGEQRVHTGPARIENHYDAHLIPVVGFPDHDPHWGAYQADGRLIDAAGHKRGPGRVLLGQSEEMRPRGEFRTVDTIAVYGGLAIPHFGHYLLSTLSRHWRNWKEAFPEAKIYLHTAESLDVWLARPYVRQTLHALGYENADFVAITEPIRVRHLIVPASGFVEQCEAHDVFGEAGRLIGERLWQGAAPTIRSEPVYLSKERLRVGVSTIQNESELVRHLRASGVRIVYPEEMSLPDQIRIFAEHHTVIGFVGSALHTCLLAPGGNRLFGINLNEYLNSNFILIDKIKNNNSTYVRPTQGMIQMEAGPNFQNAFELPDPGGIAREIMRQV